MITQSFLYNAIFFTYALVLTKFYGVSADPVPLYGLAFAVGNLVGPLAARPAVRHARAQEDDLRHVPDLRACCWPSAAGSSTPTSLTADSQTFVWIVMFFFASAGASAAYLTVSEIFPIEIRAEAIAVFFAIAQIFGAFGPLFYGWLIGDGSDRTGLYIGYLVGAGIMIFGGIVEIVLGINAEGKSLEDITKPLTSSDDGEDSEGGSPLPAPAG